MKKILAALDQGTTSSRAVIFTEDGEIIAAFNKEFPQHYPKPGWVEHDPKDILNSQITALREAVRLSGVNAADIAAIGITNQRETTFLWDRNTGECVGNAIVWQCRRTSQMVDQLVADGCGEMIREKTGCGTVLGVSNVSFGLPVREVLGSVFLTLALENGLSGAIMNPLNERMMGAMISFRTLTGRDENCAAYIQYANDLPTMQAVMPAAGATGGAKETEAKGLRRAVVKGLCKEAANLTRTALEEGRDSLDLVKEEIIPALDEVGQGFEAKKIFLPQLMMSAEAAEAAVAEIKKKAANQDAQASKGIVVLATVKGDIHDIGKNIVKLLLENYGFTVADLGKDVPPETVLEAVERLHAPICGLSALMTTTVPAMAETVALVHEKAPWCRVMVGGAVLTEEYARDIGADGYGKDAMAAVRLAERYMQEQA